MRFFIFIMFFVSILQAVTYSNTQVQNKVYFQTSPVSLVSSAQDLTASWASAGAQFDCSGAKEIAAWVNLDINDSTNARIRLLGYQTTGGASYLMPISTISASDVKVEDQYVEFNSDTDQKQIVGFTIDRLIPYCRFEVVAGSVGTTAGQIDSLDYTLGR